MKIALFSDIHANLTAFEAVLKDCFNKYGSEVAIIHLGDCIDYGMRPNEVIDKLRTLQGKMIAHIRGNHENALFGIEADRFSSQRGLEANLYTKSILSETSYNFLSSMSVGKSELTIENKKILVVHGDLSDLYWGKMTEIERKNPQYQKFDYVISGHTHISSLSYSIDKNTCQKTVFINPGSIGQPRNCNVNAQYAVLDTETAAINFEAVSYDYRLEQALYNGEIDVYYKERLLKGI